MNASNFISVHFKITLTLHGLVEQVKPHGSGIVILGHSAQNVQLPGNDANIRVVIFQEFFLQKVHHLLMEIYDEQFIVGHKN